MQSQRHQKDTHTHSVGMTDVLVLAAPSNVVSHPPKSDMHALNLIVSSKER